MKKITDIRAVELGDVLPALRSGWNLYGHPIMAGGNAPYPYQCMVKYADEEIEGEIVSYIQINAFIKETDESRCSNVRQESKKYMKSGYQPYGTIMISRKNEHGIYYRNEYLAMVKYE